MEDSQIVDLYWARSESAIEHTDIKYGRMLKGISVALVSYESDAEECLNDTYHVAWNSMPDERPVYLGAFLSKIIRRISISKFRSNNAQKRGNACELTDELEECIPSDSDVQTEFDNRLLADALNKFLLSLDEEKRHIFVRRYYYCDSVERIANDMSLSTGKVKTVLFRTRNALRNFLGEEGIPL